MVCASRYFLCSLFMYCCNFSARRGSINVVSKVRSPVDITRRPIVFRTCDGPKNRNTLAVNIGIV